MVISRVGAIVIVGLALVAGPALASPNAGPGTAPLVPLGAPFSGEWAGTPSTHPVSRGGSEYPTQWWRVAPFVRTGDQLRVGVDNSRGESDVAVCLVPSTDEFGADSALGTCRNRERIVPSGRLDRLILPHVAASGQPLLAFYGGFANRGGGYSAIVERVVVVVNIAVNPPRRIKRRFTYRAVVRYGDRTAAMDGTVGVLHWRRSGRNPGPESFRRLAGARSVRGTLRFKARLPKSTRRKVQLRSCVAQPDGGTRCTRWATVRLRK